MGLSTTEIIVNLQVEGLHCWPEARWNEPNAAYLEHPHRHIFFIKAKKKVYHDDRDVEIIEFKRKILEYLWIRYQSEYGSGLLDFKSMSCESIANELMIVFALSYCEVLEDNENGACCTPTRLSSRHIEIKFYSGYPCSGKSTIISNTVINAGISRIIVISDIVKEIKQSEFTKDIVDSSIDIEIVKRLISTMIKFIESIDPKQPIVFLIDGPRQQSIIDITKNYFKMLGFPLISSIWISATEEDCERRFNHRQRKEDSQLTFKQVLELNRGLGIEAVREHADESKLNLEKQ